LFLTSSLKITQHQMQEIFIVKRVMLLLRPFHMNINMTDIQMDRRHIELFECTGYRSKERRYVQCADDAQTWQMGYVYVLSITFSTGFT
jgi:hypothetical protein